MLGRLVVVGKVADGSTLPGMGAGTDLLPKDPRMALWPSGSRWLSFLVLGQESIHTKMVIPDPMGGSLTLVLMGHSLFP